jgi:hypothetical protein
MIGDANRTFALAHLMLTRPRSARPFTTDDVQRLDRLRPWLAHALRPQPSHERHLLDEDSRGTIGAPVRSGQMILRPDGTLVFQSPGIESLLRILMRMSSNYSYDMLVCDKLSPPLLKLLPQLASAANGTLSIPPRRYISTAYGVVTVEAKWLVPVGAIPADVARDPKNCLIAVTIELREHAVAHAARALRESGATPAQVKVGIHLALGKTKPVIADELGLQLSSVADLSKKLYQNLDIHNSAELGVKIWLDQKRHEAAHNFRLTGISSGSCPVK